MKKIIVCLIVICNFFSVNVYAAEKEGNYIESTFEFLDEFSDKTRNAVDNVEEYYKEKGYDKKVKNFFQKSKNVMNDTASSIKENFKEQHEKVEDFKESVESEKEEFYNNNPDKKEQKEEVKKEAKTLGDSIKSFFKKVSTFLFE